MRCERCTGLVVADHFIGGASSIEGWAFGGWRCVNCGAICLSGQTDGPPVVRRLRGIVKPVRQTLASGTKFHRP
jgi:hypothetical protein